MSVKQGTDILSNRLASWAPEQFEMFQKAINDGATDNASNQGWDRLRPVKAAFFSG